MAELQKLDVIVLQKDQDATHLFLCKSGASQYSKINCEDAVYSKLLHACPAMNDEAKINSDIRTRIKRKLDEMDELNLKLEKKTDDVAIPPGNTIKEIISNMEHNLTEIEIHSDLLGGVFGKDSSTAFITSYSDGDDHQLQQTATLILEPQILQSREPSVEEKLEISTIYSDLKDLYRMTEIIDDLLEAETFMTHCNTVVYFETWVLKDQIQMIEDGIMKLTNSKCVIVEEKPKPADNIPVVIKPPPILVEGFSSLVLSGCPRTGEIDPTFIISFTFPFLFGIMFADVGQGAILFMLGLYFLRKRRKVDLSEVGETYGIFLKIAGALTLCGIGSMFFGFLFGEFFGPSGLLHPILLFEIGPFKFGGFDPIHEPLTMLRFTIFLGVSFISSAMFLGLINHFRRRDFVHFFSTICWIWFLLGGFYMWLYWGGISQITVWFGEGFPMFAALVITPLILMFIILSKAEGASAAFNHTIEAFIETLGHTLSFCRIAALFLTHAALNSIFLQLGGVENGHFTLMSIPLIALGTILSLTIEGLLVMVHVLRLHWIELLPKFYSGEGTPFKPIKIRQKKENTTTTTDETEWIQH
ncbi:MAG: V-type ATPase 116kDa subunit family protein [Promethearchaeota archaeon]